MYNSGTPSVRYTLTAAHCPKFTDGLRATNGTAELMGYSAFVHELYDNDFVAYDLGTVRLNAGRTNAPYIYVGDETSDGRITVSGYASGGVPAGGNYCVHGITAVNCQLVSGGTHMDCGNDPAPWPPLGRCVYTVDFHSLNANTVVVCQGDSGGPIYYWIGGTVIAAGVVSWGRNVVWVNSPLLGMMVPCAYTGGLSVVATAVSMVPALRVVTSSAP